MNVLKFDYDADKILPRNSSKKFNDKDHEKRVLWKLYRKDFQTIHASYAGLSNVFFGNRYINSKQSKVNCSSMEYPTYVFFVCARVQSMRKLGKTFRAREVFFNSVF